MPALAVTDSPPARASSGKLAQAWRAYRNGPAAAENEDEFLQAHLPLVRSVVERMHAALPSHIEVEELYSVGVLGLVQAARGFRPDQNTAFSTYATTRIRGAILDELRRLDWMPRRSRAKAKVLRDVIGQLEQQFGRPATEAEVATAMSLSMEQYSELLDEVRPVTCLELDAPSGDEDADGATLHDVIGLADQRDARSEAEKNEMLAMMAERVARLPDMQKKVLAFYYFEEMRLAEIAVIFGVTESRICQVHAQAILSLRQTLKPASER